MLAGFLGMLGIGALIGTLLDNTVMKVVATAVVLFASVGVLAVLTASRSRWRQRSLSDKAMLNKYCHLMLGGDPNPYWRVTSWKQTVMIDENGDSTISVEFCGVSERDNLPFFRFRLGSGWNQPSRDLRRVSAQVRSVILGDGIGGTRCDHNETWREDGKLQIFVHFPTPIQLGSEFKVSADVKWPGRCRPLMKDRRPEEFCVTAGGQMDLLEYKVVLPADCEAFYDPVGFRNDDDAMLVCRNTPDGRPEIVVSVRDLDEERRIGMRVDLK